MRKNERFEDREIVIVDYAKECYSRLPDDDSSRVVFNFYFPEALRSVLDNLIQGRIDMATVQAFKNYTSQFTEMQGPFIYTVPKDIKHLFKPLAAIIFDYLGSIYLMGKI